MQNATRDFAFHCTPKSFRAKIDLMVSFRSSAEMKRAMVEFEPVVPMTNGRQNSL